jgi:hypothetical protein
VVTDNSSILITEKMAVPGKNVDALIAEEQLADPSFRAEWQRLAPGP